MKQQKVTENCFTQAQRNIDASREFKEVKGETERERKWEKKKKKVKKEKKADRESKRERDKTILL